MITRRSFVGGGAVTLLVALGCRPLPPPPPPTVTEADVAEWVGRIAADSTRGRNTPSAELDRLADVVAATFATLGLSGGPDGMIQRYRLVSRRIVPERSGIEWRGGGGSGRLAFGAAVGFAQGAVPDEPVPGPVVLLGGAIDPLAIPGDRLAGKLVVWAADFTGPGAERADGIVATLVAGAPAGVLIVPNQEAVVGALLANQPAERLTPPTPGLAFTALVASEGAVTASAPELGRAIAAAREAPGTVFDSTGLEATVTIVDSAVGSGSAASAPNVFGIRRGDDRDLRDEYLIVSAHMDHLGMIEGADSVMNGADDNASGAAGVLLLAKSLSQPGLRLGRSVLFLLVSGEEKGLWGSAYFAAHPPIPLAQVVGLVNLDMIGRGWRDTVGVIGREFSSLDEVLDSVAAAHPELGVTPIGDVWPDQKRFYRSDQYAFARRGVPALFLSSGYSEDYHAPTDSPDKIDAEKEARLLTLLGRFIIALSNRPGSLR